MKALWLVLLYIGWIFATPASSTAGDFHCLLSPPGCREFWTRLRAGPRKPDYGAAKLRDGVLYVSSRLWRSEGLQWLYQAGEEIRASKSLPDAGRRPNVTQVTIFVHGYSAPTDTIGSYFGDMIETLSSRGRHPGAIVVLDWPSNAQHWEFLSLYEQDLLTRGYWSHEVRPSYNYEPSTTKGPFGPMLRWEFEQYKSDQAAASSVGAPSLAALIKELQVVYPHTHINIVAHSMGSQVVLLALDRYRGLYGNIRRIILLAPDVPYDALEAPGLRETIGGFERLYVFFSKNDPVLSLESRVANLGKRLGAAGPKNASVFIAYPTG